MQACPARCIDVHEDEEGFLFPKFDVLRCLNCGKCLKVCPVTNEIPRLTNIACYAYRSRDEDLLKKTSSGGFFTAAAERVLAEGGAVFGAAFNAKNEVVHTYIESPRDLDSLRRSKYVQSRGGNAFIKCKSFLNNGRKVLFCGTPCQIKALKLFLGKDYEILTTIDFVCHGVPSPGVFKRYLSELAEKKGHTLSELHDINFRDKGLGFACSYSFSFSFGSSFCRETPKENVFLKGFLADLYLRRSCHNCKAKGFSSGADYTMCDFWAVERFLPGFAGKTVPGVSQIFVVDDKLGLFAHPIPECAQKLDIRQKGMVQVWAVQSVPRTRRRDRFYQSYLAGQGVEVSVLTASKQTRFGRIVSKTKGMVELVLRRVFARSRRKFLGIVLH